MTDDLSEFLKPGQTPLERMKQDQQDVLALMALLQKEKELTEKLKWALQDAITTNTESCRQRDAANHRVAALERIIYHYVDPSDARQDDEAFLLEIVRRLSNDSDAGQPWLRTYDAHLKGGQQ